MKIHFAALFGVDYDMDLLPYWASYYLNMKLDSYKIFLHRENGPIPANTAGIFKNLGFNVETLGGPHGDGIIRKLTLGGYAASLPPSDFLVTADADEFQQTPSDDIPDYRFILATHDVVSGFLIDRFSNELEACREEPFHQYFHEEPEVNETLKKFTPPFLRKTSWPYMRRTKILAARAGHEVSYIGSHLMFSIPSSARIAENFRVKHFAWREAARAKLSIKTYFSADNLNEIYGGQAPEGVLSLFNAIRPELLRSFEENPTVEVMDA